MSLDKKYFNSLELELIKNKYYSAKEVDEILLDIRTRAAQQAKETEILKKQLEKYANQKEEISEAVIAAREAYKEIIDKANKKAESIIAQAEERSAEVDAKAAKSEEFYIGKVEKMFEKLKGSHDRISDELNRQWQDFLVSFAEEGQDDNSNTDEAQSAEVSEKIAQIAKRIRDM